jgi:Flp pilus assembly protein TadG
METLTRKQRSVRRRLADERGQAALELMLVFPVFMFITFIALDLGIWMYQSVTVANSVREAARYGSVTCGTGSCTDATIAAKAVEKSNGVLDAADVDVGWVARPGAAAGDRGSSIVVKANHTYNSTFFFAFSVPVISCADMRLEQDDSGTVSAGSDC